MDLEQFRVLGKSMIDFICSFQETLAERRVTAAVEPGYLKSLLPVEAPVKSESWTEIIKDIENLILPGMTHWQHPNFFAYFPTGNSYPSILGDLLSAALGCIGFSWAASPACTELEAVVLYWLGKMMGLPEQFLAPDETSKGGGTIQSNSSECILVSILAAREVGLRKLEAKYRNTDRAVLLTKLVMYCSREAHSCVEKAALIAYVKLRVLETDANNSLQADVLKQAITEDKEFDLLPFFVCATLGTTSCCSFDNLVEIGPLCQKEHIWLHVDAAYAGCAFICPEYRFLMAGIEFADSLNIETSKWLLVNFDCTTMWVKDKLKLIRALNVNRIYLQHSHSAKNLDYRHWGIHLSRRFRSLKLWFVIRNLGIRKMQNYIREHCRLAKRFELHVISDPRFEVMNEVQLGVVCFRLRGARKINLRLLSLINSSGRLYLVPVCLNGTYAIRFCVCCPEACDEHIGYLKNHLISKWRIFSDDAWSSIKIFANQILKIDKADCTTLLYDEKLVRRQFEECSLQSSFPNEEDSRISASEHKLIRTFSLSNPHREERENWQRNRIHSIDAHRVLVRNDTMMHMRLTRRNRSISRSSLDLSDIEGLLPDDLGLSTDSLTFVAWQEMQNSSSP